jgi:tetratricopeptide (TPR) repeat protein
MTDGSSTEKGGARVLGICLAVMLVLALTGASMQRNVRWRTLLAMWQDCVRKSPDKSRTHNNVGNCHVLLKEYFPAIAEYQKAIELEPGNMEAYFNLAQALDIVGLYNPAMRNYDIFCRNAPPQLENAREKACLRLRELMARARQGGAPGTMP